jgi:hypothetical protein
LTYEKRIISSIAKNKKYIIFFSFLNENEASVLILFKIRYNYSLIRFISRIICSDIGNGILKIRIEIWKIIKIWSYRNYINRNYVFKNIYSVCSQLHIWRWNSICCFYLFNSDIVRAWSNNSNIFISIFQLCTGYLIFSLKLSLSRSDYILLYRCPFIVSEICLAKRR